MLRSIQSVGRSPLVYYQFSGLHASKSLLTLIGEAGGGGDFPTGCTLAVIQADGATFRFRSDGTDPTGSVGHLMADADVIELGLPEMKLARFINATSQAPGAAGKLSVSFYAY